MELFNLTSHYCLTPEDEVYEIVVKEKIHNLGTVQFVL